MTNWKTKPPSVTKQRPLIIPPFENIKTAHNNHQSKSQTHTISITLHIIAALGKKQQ